MNFSRIFIIAFALAAPAVHAQTNPIFSALQSVQSAIAQTRQLLPQTAGSGAQGSQPIMNEQETQMYNSRKAADAQARQQAQEDSAKQAAAAQSQGQAQMQQQMEAQRASDQRYGTGSAGYASDQAAIQASIRRDAERQQRDAAEARSMPNPCPGVSPKLSDGAFVVACKNAGATEQQLLARLGALPMMQQALYANIIQDIYDNNVTDQKKGDAVAKYDARCTAQANCQRIAW